MVLRKIRDLEYSESRDLGKLIDIECDAHEIETIPAYGAIAAYRDALGVVRPATAQTPHEFWVRKIRSARSLTVFFTGSFKVDHQLEVDRQFYLGSEAGELTLESQESSAVAYTINEDYINFLAPAVTFVATTIEETGRPVMTSDRTYYVNANQGSDESDGLSEATAFATIVKALREIELADWSGYKPTVILATGNYRSEGRIHLPLITGGKSVTCLSPAPGSSNPVGTLPNPQATILSVGNASYVEGFELDHFGYWSLENLVVEPQLNSTEPAIVAQRSAVIECYNVFINRETDDGSPQGTAVAARSGGEIILEKCRLSSEFYVLFEASDGATIRTRPQANSLKILEVLRRFPSYSSYSGDRVLAQIRDRSSVTLLAPIEDDSGAYIDGNNNLIALVDLAGGQLRFRYGSFLPNSIVNQRNLDGTGAFGWVNDNLFCANVFSSNSQSPDNSRG